MNTKLASFLIRIGLAAVFFYAAISSFLEPNSWVGFFPGRLREIIPGGMLLTGFSVFELFMGLWLISGKYAFYSGLVAAAALFGIIVANMGSLQIIFRDIAIMFSAIALMFLEKK